MANFEVALKRTLSFEGSYSNNPNDKGGETYCGISRKAWPKWDGWEYIDRLNKDGLSIDKAEPALVQSVRQFYHFNFWLPLRADEIESQEIANYLFDFAVNSGIGDAVKALQKANNRWFPDSPIGVDGIIGHDTITALFVYTDSPHAFLDTFKLYRLHHILKNIGNDKIHPSFAKGLADRALNA